MSSKIQIQKSGFCPTQKKDVIVYGNYIHDGFDEYVLGTISCPYKNLAKECKENPCPLHSLFPNTIQNI